MFFELQTTFSHVKETTTVFLAQFSHIKKYDVQEIMTNYVISFNHHRFALTIELLPLYMVLEMMIGAAGIGTRTAFKQLEH